MNREVLTITDLNQITLGSSPVFENTCGLTAMYSYTSDHYPPVRIVDNHNLVLPFWWESVQKNNTGAVPCIHIDQHADLSSPHAMPDSPRTTHEDVRSYTENETTIASFIVPALQQSVISECRQVRSEFALYELIDTPANAGSYLLDIDIDFRSMSSESEIDTHCRDLQLTLQNALCISIATSPTFIDQAKALSIIKKLFLL